MKAKQLKNILSFIDDEEDIFIDVGGRRTELASFKYDGQVCLTSHNYMMDDNVIVFENICRYLNKK